MKNADWFAAVPCGAKTHAAPPPLIVTVALPLAPATGPVYVLAPGVTVFEGTEAGLVPIAFVAVTVHAIGTPLTSPVTAIGELALVAVRVPHVAVYDVMAEPPSDAGAANDTVACVSPGVAVTAPGASGTLTGVTLLEADAGPVPTAFVAVTLHATAAPFASPVTTSGEAAPEALCAPHVAV
jgi:hypothetical protein